MSKQYRKELRALETQIRRASRDPATAENPFLVQNPSRGVIEAKPPREDLNAIVGSGDMTMQDDFDLAGNRAARRGIPRMATHAFRPGR